MSARRGSLLVVALLVSAPVPRLARASDGPAEALVTPFIAEGGESGHRVHLQMRTTALYSTFSPALGLSVRLDGQLPVWNTRLATGTFDFGVIASFAFGASVLYPWVTPSADEDHDENDLHVRLLATAGHTFHLGRSRRASLGVHLAAGPSLTYSYGKLVFLREHLSGSGSSTSVGLAWGPEVDFHYRFTRRVGINLLVGGAVPTALVGGPPGPLIHAGVGLTVYLR